MGDELLGKVVVITGSTRGIGRAMAEACAAAGATVVVSSRSVDAVTATVEALRATGARVSGIACDVSRPGDLQELLDHAVAEHGQVDVWVNNAGISLGLRLHVDTSAEEIYDILGRAPGIAVSEDRANNTWPMPVTASGADDVLVGRVRRDISTPNTFDIWVVGDQLLKGAALNAVQIAELL